ncbi:MAG: hypothetical protein U0795_26225 [Pirellulales bacterium]
MDGSPNSPHDLPLASDSTSGRGTLMQRVFAWQNKDTVFYVVSIGLHVAVAFILAGSWKSSTTRTAQQTPAAPQAAPPAPVARLEIDVAPVRYSDMDIRSLVPGAKQVRVSPPQSLPQAEPQKTSAARNASEPRNATDLPTATPAGAPVQPAPSANPVTPENRAVPGNPAAPAGSATPSAPVQQPAPSMELNPAARAVPTGTRGSAVEVTPPRLGFSFIDTEAAPTSPAGGELGIGLTGSGATEESTMPMSISARLGLEKAPTQGTQRGVRR